MAYASPPGFVFWEKKPLQLLVYAMWELSKVERRDMREEIIYHFRICAPNLRVQPDSLRLPEMANPAFFAQVSKFVQRNFFSRNAANLTEDDAMCYDYGMWIAERIYQDKQWWIANTNMQRSLDDNFALTPAKTAVIPLKEQLRKGTEKLQRVFEDVEVPAFSEAHRFWTKERPIGIQIIKTRLREVAQSMHKDGQSYQQWIQAGKQTLSQLAREK